MLKNVRIGIGFHWDRTEDQEFQGELEIVERPLRSRTKDKRLYTAVNTLDLEDYLCSVISSEMSADSPMELLKAHAVISRSWAMRAIQNKPHEHMVNGQMVNIFDVCADDHCQRYEGLRRMNERAVEAVRATRGQVLINEHMVNGQMVNELCDCRYHKCCGGRTEIWRTCWEDMDVPYIQSVECPYCGRISDRTLRMVLNDYDQETRDFHDWKVTYTAEELSAIIREKSGIDFGEIIDLIPLKRGASGRICELKIVGTRRTEIIGKELKIRLWLSRKCLYSSWFEVKKSSDFERSGLSTFDLIGHGWGHGAGLCQIGAAQMAAEGKTYEEILAYYYRNTKVKGED